MTNKPIVIIDDDKSICKTLKLHFERQGCNVVTAYSAKDGLRELENIPSAIVILDIRLPDANGVDLLKEIRKSGENYFSIMITAFPDMESTVKAVQCGAGEYIHKPLDIHEIDAAMIKAGNFFSNQKHTEQQYVPVPDYDPHAFHFVGKSPIIKELFKTVGMVSMSKATVHISGESGTGKELVAKAIHQHSESSSAPFISVNCSAIVETLLESELFGHVKGSFTGAISNREGKFALAKNGTIFLDEIAEMSFNLQAKLLRVLQEHEFEMVGGKETLKAECRMVSATNKDLHQMVKEGKFREDLYYRLKVINIHIPPIRERVEDIPFLILHFLSKTNMEINRNIQFISREAIDYLMTCAWKGNIREIENAVTHVVAMTQGECLTKDHFKSVVKGEYTEKQNMDAMAPENMDYSSQPGNEEMPLSLNEIEKVQVRKTLEYTKWHKGKTCEILGISRPRLDRKMKKYGIKRVRPYIYEN